MVDLNNIKTQLKTILDGANSASASPIDLSYGMVNRVQQVLKINPERIPIQPSLFPCVSMYVDNKTVKSEDICKNQITGKRSAEVSLKLVGIVWLDSFTNISTDNADEDCEKLMENMEYILRNNHDLNSTCSWSFPNGVDYFSGVLDEQTHLRAGVMDFKIKVFY